VKTASVGGGTEVNKLHSALRALVALQKQDILNLDVSVSEVARVDQRDGMQQLPADVANKGEIEAGEAAALEHIVQAGTKLVKDKAEVAKQLEMLAELDAVSAARDLLQCGYLLLSGDAVLGNGADDLDSAI
jgi:hypothetical protein